MVNETIAVTGMHCPKCTERVEKAVERIDGVDSAQADFENDLCTIVYDGAAETMAAVKAAIIEEGFSPS